MILNGMWDLLSAFRASPVTWLKAHPVYRDTLFKFQVADHPKLRDYVALTIDDGLCRGGPEKSMVKEVLALLKQHNARAAFFIIYDFFNADDGRLLLRDGHEFGNHCCADRSYSNDSKEDFEEQLLRANEGMQRIMPSGKRVRWFRSPQGMYSRGMCEVIEKHAMHHVLGNAYCNDFATDNSKWIAEQLLSQASSGSVIIIHIPEREHWEWNLESLRLLLEGLSARGLQAVTLSELAELAGLPDPIAQRPYQEIAASDHSFLSSVASVVGDALQNVFALTATTSDEASKAVSQRSLRGLGASSFCITTHHGRDDVTGQFFEDESCANQEWRCMSIGKAHLLIDPSGVILKRWGLPLNGSRAREEEMMEWRRCKLAHVD